MSYQEYVHYRKQWLDILITRKHPSLPTLIY